MSEGKGVRSGQGDRRFGCEYEFCVGLSDLETTGPVAEDIFKINESYIWSNLQLVADHVLVGVVNRPKVDAMATPKDQTPAVCEVAWTIELMNLMNSLCRRNN